MIVLHCDTAKEKYKNLKNPAGHIGRSYYDRDMSIKILQNLADTYEAKAKTVRDIGKLFEAQFDPELAKALIEVLTPMAGITTNGHFNGSSGHFDTIASVFGKSGNDWMSINEIAKGANMKPDGVRQVLYKAKKDTFEKRKREGQGKTVEFKLKK